MRSTYCNPNCALRHANIPFGHKQVAWVPKKATAQIPFIGLPGYSVVVTPEQKMLLQKLIIRKDELLQLGDLTIEKTERTPNARADEDEQPLEEMNQVIASRRNVERTRELQRIDTALKRLKAAPEDFGLCENCDDPIPLRRLEIMPWARFCVVCQSQRDPARGKRRKHIGDFQ